MIFNDVIVFVAKDMIFVAGLLTALFWLRLPRVEKATFAVRFAIAGVLALILSQGIAHFYYDTRPFVRLHQAPLFPHVPDNGFPSDHTTLTMLAALTCLAYSRWAGAALIVLALMIGSARVLSLVHSPTDIAGSIAIAALSTAVAAQVVRQQAQRATRARKRTRTAGEG